MKEHETNFTIGDSVQVKKGVKDPDFKGLRIEGWQGRITEITEEKEGPSLVHIEWDSTTLKNMPAKFIEKCEEDGLGYTSMYLFFQDVEKVTARDTQKEVAAISEKLALDYAWSSFGEEGRRIQQVMAGVDKTDGMAVLEAWEQYLGKKLVFPFDAEVAEYQERGPLQAGDRVSVKNIAMIDDLYGILVELTQGRRKYTFPLCDLEVVKKKSANYQPVSDYCVWFANR